MEQHHQDSIANITNKFKEDREVLALLIGGSIAHGFQKPNSDVDIMIVISEEEYARRAAADQLNYYETESCAYEGGYIDGKYITLNYMEQVALKGSDPARFAFEGTQIAFSHIDRLSSLIERIVTYPIEAKQERINKFMGQLEAWNWYCYEAIKHDNKYLLNHSVSNLILFGGRMILTHNEQLYPYHKWFLKVIERAPHKPDGLMNLIDHLLNDPTKDNIEAFYNSIRNFTEWGTGELNWPNQFMKDSELSWLYGAAPVADL